MKLQQQGFAALCLLMLVASEMAVTTNAAAAPACEILKMAACLPASKNAQLKPTDQCCANVRTMGAGMAGAQCLCDLLTQPLAKQQGVVLATALSIPQRCAIAVPKGFRCQGILVPGA